MRSQGKGNLSATMRKREGVEPRNIQHCTGSGISFSGNQNQYTRNGEEVDESSKSETNNELGEIFKIFGILSST